jgi:glucose/arabinose dehydrogenase
MAVSLAATSFGQLVDAPPVGAAKTLPAGFTDQVVASGLNTPTAVTFLPGGATLVAEKRGIVKLLTGSQLSTFLDIRDKVNAYWDRGLMGLAVDPEFASNGYVYTLYSYDPAGNETTGPTTARLVRYTANADRTAAEPATATVLLGDTELAQCPPTPDPNCVPQDIPGHAVDDVRFASDGTLFVSMGDSSSWEFADSRALRALNVDHYPGKILRVDRAGRGLPTNPHAVADLGAIRSKVWARGFRNPFRLHLRPGDDLPFVGDVGWDQFEEIDVARRGANFGWPCFEGAHRQPAHRVAATCQALYAEGSSAVSGPLITWGRVDGNSAVAGPFTPETTDFPALYRDGFFYADYGGDWIRFAKITGGGALDGAPRPFASGLGNPVDLEFGPDGDLYYVAIGRGELRRISYDATGPGSTDGEIRISSLAPSENPVNGHGPYEVNRSNGGGAAGDGRPLSIAGVRYEHGLGVHALSDLRFTIPDGCTGFRAATGIDDEVPAGGGSVVFQVWDETATLLAQTPVLRRDDPFATVITADITGVSTLRLVVTDAGDGGDGDHADWAAATLSCGSGGDPPGEGAPEVEIATPSTAHRFTIGETLELSGHATDTQDGVLPSSALTWQVDLQHCTTIGCHGHPLTNLTGANPSFVVPDHEDGTFLRVTLTATDADGHVGRAVRDVHPRVSTLTLTSNPVGREVFYGGQAVTTPFQTDAIVGGVRVISAHSPQDGWEFSSWSDAGAAQHAIRVATAPVTYSATYVVPDVPPTRTVYLSDLNPVRTPVNGLGPYERDRANGRSAPRDGGTLTINGTTYAKGLGTRARSDLRYRVPAGCTAFTAQVGIDDEVGANRGLAAFSVWKGTTTRLFTVTRSGAQGPMSVNVPLAGVSTLRLRVGAGADGTKAGDNADWADAKLTCGPQTTVAFGPATVLPAGNHAHSVAAADLDGDGRIDIATANAGADDVRVLLQRTDGTYAGPHPYTTGDQPKSVAVGDVNGDGRPDLVTADQGAPGGVSVLLGNGDGTFQPRLAVGACGGAHEATISDVNADGRLDIAVACWGGSVISILLGDGTGTFGRRDVTTGAAPHSVAAGDFNGDGRIDLATANRGSNNVSVLLGGGDGMFAAHVTYAVGAGPHSIRAGDLDTDGRLDLVVANDASNTISVLRGTGNGTFLAKVDYRTGQTPKGVALADIDRDGRLDVVTANIRGNYPNLVNPGGDSVSVLLGVGAGVLAAKTDYTVGVGSFSAQVRDVDGDGWVDLLTANWHDGTVTFRRGTRI